MIKYTLYEEGGKLFGTLEERTPLRVGRKINIQKFKVKIVRATRRDIALIFNDDPGVTAIAHIKRIKALP